MEKYYSVSFKYSETTYCTNIAHAESPEAVNAHYSKYEWVNVTECGENEVATAKRKGMPIIEIESKQEDNTMKKFIDILEEIKLTRKAITAAEAREQELVAGYMKICDLRERHEARKAAENNMTKASEEKKNLQITIKILKNNAKIALFNEVLPVALEVLTNYSGKPYGEKTKQKISEAIKEKTNCRFYIGSRYGSDSFEVDPVYPFGNDYDISCGTDYTDGSKKPLLVDNKIQTISFEEIALYYISREYVEDIPQRVEAIKAAHLEAVAKQEELKAACSRFNALAVGDIDHLYYDKQIYANMTI